MKIIVYYPATENGMNELKRSAAKIHAEAAATYITNLPCPKAQKLELLNSLRSNAK